MDKIAAITKSKEDSRTGSGAKNSRNFVFARLDKQLGEEEEDEDIEKEANLELSATNTVFNREKKKSQKTKFQEPPKKMTKITRSLDENSRDTIFGHM